MSEQKAVKVQETVVTKIKLPHPPAIEMVKSAIEAGQGRKGLSLSLIKKYISQSFNIDIEKYGPFLRRSIKNGVEKGSLIRVGNGKGASGSFKLPKVVTKSKNISSDKKVKEIVKKTQDKKPTENKVASKSIPKKQVAKISGEKKPESKKPVSKKSGDKKPVVEKSSTKTKPTVSVKVAKAIEKKPEKKSVIAKKSSKSSSAVIAKPISTKRKSEKVVKPAVRKTTKEKK